MFKRDVEYAIRSKKTGNLFASESTLRQILVIWDYYQCDEKDYELVSRPTEYSPVFGGVSTLRELVVD